MTTPSNNAEIIAGLQTRLVNIRARLNGRTVENQDVQSASSGGEAGNINVNYMTIQQLMDLQKATVAEINELQAEDAGQNYRTGRTAILRYSGG